MLPCTGDGDDVCCALRLVSDHDTQQSLPLSPAQTSLTPSQRANSLIRRLLLRHHVPCLVLPHPPSPPSQRRILSYSFLLLSRPADLLHRMKSFRRCSHVLLLRAPTSPTGLRKWPKVAGSSQREFTFALARRVLDRVCYSWLYVVREYKVTGAQNTRADRAS
eukprot:745959-Hanusia_phi.AAC.2